MIVNKKVLLTPIIGILLFMVEAMGQAGKLPPFRMMQANNTVFKAEYLPMGKPIVIIYFSPECDHFLILMKDLLKGMSSFNKASVAMITHLPVSSVASLMKKYNLNKYSNVYVGTEGSTYFVRNYYKITEMPFMALYTKNGDQVKLYREEGALPRLVTELNKLK